MLDATRAGRSAASATSRAFSFHETKNVISGEGGALLVNDPTLVERAEIIREKGTNRSAVLPRPGRQVHLGGHRLVVPAERDHRRRSSGRSSRGRRRSPTRRARRCGTRYHDGVRRGSSAPGVARRPIVPREAAAQRAHLFPAAAPASAHRASASSTTLRRDGVNAVFHYVPLHSSPAGRKYGRTSGEHGGHRRDERAAGAAAAVDRARIAAGPRH